MIKWIKDNLLLITIGLGLTYLAVDGLSIERGYKAMGGEYLVLPALLLARQVVLDLVSAFKDLKNMI